MLTFDGTAWRITGKDCADGRRVRAIRAEGTLVIVDPMEY
jgi:membrane protein implicated in regulation of membrane protease activity